MSEAVVVGAGPNGLACAVTLAREGIEVRLLEAADTIGGGARSRELTIPGLLHDDCSAIHAMGIASACFRSLELTRYGLEWRHPPIDLAHPLDDGSAAVMVRDLGRTAAGLGEDGPAWRRLFGSASVHLDDLNQDLMRPFVHIPRHPVRLVRFGLGAAVPATLLARRFRTPQARALFGGVAAHLCAPLTRPMSSAVGVALITACHAFGWPVARGGSQAVSDALAAALRDHGGEIETGRRVRSLGELGDPDAVAFNLAPPAVAEIAGERLPDRVARAYRRYRFGPAAFKLDIAVEGGIPWLNEDCRRAGTLHLGGSFEETVRTEAEVAKGRMPERPFVLVGQQYLADRERSNGDVHPVWAYAHVPHHWDGDGTEAIIRQIERFAPGVRERIVGTATRSPREFESYNANYVGGDILTGRNTPLNIVFRPRLALNPYATGLPGVYICSAATPPGPGVHGMCGYNAARFALRRLA